MWSWGDGDYGKLGRGGSDGCKVPMKIESLAGLGVIKVECGSQFSVALTRSGSVYTWGKGDYHRLGHGNSEHIRRPKKVAALQGKKIVSIATGSLHCIAVSQDNFYSISSCSIFISIYHLKSSALTVEKFLLGVTMMKVNWVTEQLQQSKDRGWSTHYKESTLCKLFVGQLTLSPSQHVRIRSPLEHFRRHQWNMISCVISNRKFYRVDLFCSIISPN